VARRFLPAVVALALVPALGLLSGGAVGAGERAALAVLVALSALAALAASPRAVDARALRVGGAAAVVALALALGLVPVPRALLDAVAPGVAAARPHDARWTLSLRSEATSVALATWAVVAGVAVVATAVGVDRRRWATGLAWGTVAWAALGAGHALTGTHALLGLFPARSPEGPWFAPLVNPNHHVAVLLAGVPFVADAVRRRPASWTTLPFGATLAWAVAAPIVARSMGGVLALGVLALAALAGAPWTARARAAAGAALVAAGGCAAVAVVRLQPEWWLLSGSRRLTQWADTLRMLPSFPLTGTGAGAYEAAFRPFRTSTQFHTFDHVHADPLEWVAELGLVGLVAIGAALALLPRARGEGVRPWTLALVALVAAASVDFPLHLPGVAALAALLVAGRQAGDPAPRTAHGAWLVGVAAVALAAGWRLTQRERADEALAAVRVEHPAPEVIAAAAALAPWAAEPVVARLAGAWDPTAADDAGRRLADDGAAQLRLAALAARAHDAGRARAFLERSLERDPNDPRAWRLLAALRLGDGDRRGAAEATAAALVRWPGEDVGDTAAFDAAYALLPVGLWWLEALEPANARWSIRLAQRLLADGQPEVAELACDQAARLRPVTFGHNPECAEALAVQRRDDEALAYLQAWVDEEPDNYVAWVTTARVAARIDRPAAKGLWQRALLQAWALDPGAAAVCGLLGGELQQACAASADALQPGTCALAAVARQGRGTPGASWLASHPAFRARADDPDLWAPCR
jgi:tetratricopeptide (TPR) repeat protein